MTRMGDRETREAIRRRAALRAHFAAQSDTWRRARLRVDALSDVIGQLDPGTPERSTVQTALTRARAALTEGRDAKARARAALAAAELELAR